LNFFALQNKRACTQIQKVFRRCLTAVKRTIADLPTPYTLSMPRFYKRGINPLLSFFLLCRTNKSGLAVFALHGKKRAST